MRRHYHTLIVGITLLGSLLWPSCIFAQEPTWSSPVSLTGNPTNRKGEPSVAVDRYGTVHAVYVDNFRVYYQKRPGSTWAAPTDVTSTSGFPTSTDYYSPKIAIGINNIPHLLITGAPRGPGTAGIYHTSYKDGSWQPAVRVSRSHMNGYMYRQPLAIGADGTVHAIWKENLGWAGDQVFYSKKVGNVWSEPVQVTGNEDEALQAVALLDGDTVRFVFATYPTKLIRERRLVGATWQNPTTLFSNVSVNNDSFTAAFGVNGGMTIVWVKVEGSTHTLEASSLSGSAWSAPTAIFTESPPRYAREPIAKVDDYGQAHLSFFVDQWQDDQTDRILYMHQSATGWTQAVALSSGNDADAPFIVAMDKVYAVWRQRISGSLYDIYFTASSEIAARTPVVLVPGIAASWNWGVMSDLNLSDTNWMWSPTTDKGWEGLITALEAAGYQKDKHYSIAFYDWRKTNDWLDNDPDAAKAAKVYLKAAIDKVKAANPGVSKVHVVAHSMGGLVVRSYVESGEYRGDIDQAIFVGTPNQGAAFSYYMWSGAEVPPSWDLVSRSVVYTYLKYLEILKQQNAIQIIRTQTRSLKNLLPVSSNYLTTNGNSLQWDLLSEVNTFLKTTSPSDSISSRFAAKGVRLSTIHGTGVNTVHQMSVEPYQASFGSLWKDGKPTGDITTINGDGTVTELSAKITGVESSSLISKHARLPSDAAEIIMRKLGRVHTLATIALPSSILTVWTHPVTDVTVEDPDTNTPVGTKLEEREDGGFKVITVPEPKKPKYRVKLKGQGTGKFKVGSDLHTETSSTPTEKEGTAKQGVTISYTLAVATTSATPLLLSPDDTKAPQTTLASSGSTVTLTAQDDSDGTGVGSTEYSFDSTTWSTYTSPFTISSTTTIYYRSTDLVGNMEPTKSSSVTVSSTTTSSQSSNSTSSTSTAQVLGAQAQKQAEAVTNTVKHVPTQVGRALTSVIDDLLGNEPQREEPTGQQQPLNRPEVKAESTINFFAFMRNPVVIVAVVTLTLAGGAVGISVASGSGFFGKFKL